MQRIVVAVDDSAPGLAAASASIEIAQRLRSTLVFVTVNQPGTDPDKILDHARKMATEAGLDSEVVTCAHGPAFEAILAEAHRQRADLVVVGRSDKQRPGAPHVGSQTEHVLEFTDVPVLVIPTPTRASGRGRVT